MSVNFGCVLRNLVELLVIGGFGRLAVMFVVPQSSLVLARSMILAAVLTTTSVFAPLSG